MSCRHALIILFLSVPAGGLLSARGQEEPDFFTRAHDLRRAEDWPGLEQAAREQFEVEPDDPAIQAFLALACAGQKKFEDCVAALKRLEELNSSAERTAGGITNPLVEVFNVIYMHCWANFSPEFNRQCWQGLFDAFPGFSQASVMASRLLMAALKLNDPDQIERFRIYFDDLLEQAGDSPPRRKSVLGQYARAYVRAGVGGDRTLALAREAFEIGWNEAAAFRGYAGPSEDGDDFEKREHCDLACDDLFNDLALACVLSLAYDPERNPLAAREAEPGAVFEDLTEAVGLAGLKAGRVAAGDFDNDGDPDLCFSGRLFRNDRGLEFVEITQEAGLKARGSSALFGDVDNDGDLDLLLPAQGHPHLLLNTGKAGGFRFEDATAAAGLDRLEVEAAPEGAAFLDIDGDGWLDFYLAVYEGGGLSNPHPDLLVLNNGDGTFTDVSRDRGALEVAPMCGRGVAASDFDQDGDLDLYIANYRLNPNFLFQNDGQGRFVEQALEFGIRGLPGSNSAYYGHTIGACFGDVDNDGDLDLFAANLAHPRYVSQGFSNLSMLYINGGAEDDFHFTEERRARGIRFQETHSDPALIDYDNDGDLDLSITCVYEGVPSSLYQNDGRGRFTPVTFRSRAVAFNGFGQAWFDADGDGDLDLLIASNSGCRYFRNGGNENSWLEVRLVGKQGNRFGIGARVELETLTGEPPLRLVRELDGGRGTSSQDGQTVHFGLGEYRGKVRLTVTWPGARQSEKRAFYVNRTVTVRQFKG